VFITCWNGLLILKCIAKPTFDIKGRYKWDAWTELKGMCLENHKERVYLDFFFLGKSQEDAEKEYIAFVEELKAKQ
jgi:diazepam-binding inhibitor (GABA receptor modulating acyl-CoA-binding protein)